jgi:hypothetical protein
MAIADLIEQILGTGSEFSPRGPRGWKNRLRETIDFISPDGDTFSAKWVGDPRSFEKKLGIWNYAKVKGTIVQDLGNTSTSYPLTIYFDGDNHDKTANQFFEACSQTGTWQVTHPTKGFVELQLMKITENIQPITDGGHTVFNTDWIEPIDPVLLKTTAQIKAESGQLINEFNEIIVDEFAGKVDTENFGALQAIKDTTNTIVAFSENTLGPIADLEDAVRTSFDAVQRGIQEVLSATIFDPLSLAAQIVQLAQLPALAIRDIRSRLNAYGELATSIFDIDANKPGSEGTNIARTKAALLSGIIGAANQIALSGIDAALAGGAGTGQIQTKAQAIESIEQISALFKDITDNMDADQELTKDETIDEQYFSQSQSFATALNLTGLGLQYLLENFFNLKIEKVFILSVPSTPIKLTIENYGGMGENDSNHDLLIDSNGLKGDRIIWLPVGTEIVIYA